MRLLIISDIHGNYNDLEKVVNKEKFDQLIILGDLFNYGSFSKKDEIINLLIQNRNKLVLIKGNCDFDIPMLPCFEVITLPYNGHLITFTHGHIYNKTFLPSSLGDIFVQGHTHVPTLSLENKIIYANPGSLGLPRYGSSKSYMILDEKEIIIKTVDEIIIKKMEI